LDFPCREEKVHPQQRGSEADLGWMRQFLRWQTSLKLNDLKKAAARRAADGHLDGYESARGYPILTPDVHVCGSRRQHYIRSIFI
jgi:hypothetical protein